MGPRRPPGSRRDAVLDAPGARVYHLESAGHWGLRTPGRAWAKRGRGAPLQSPSHHPVPRVKRARFWAGSSAPKDPPPAGWQAGPVGFSSLVGLCCSTPAEDNEGRLPRQPRSGVPSQRPGTLGTPVEDGMGGSSRAQRMPPPRALTVPGSEVGEGASPQRKDLTSRGPRTWMQARGYWGHGQPNSLEK